VVSFDSFPIEFINEGALAKAGVAAQGCNGVPDGLIFATCPHAALPRAAENHNNNNGSLKGRKKGMDSQKYEMMVWSLQGEALGAPGWFRARVVFISLFAYVMLFSLVGALLAGLVFMYGASHGSIILKLIFASWVLVVAPIVWLSFRMFFKGTSAPEGRELDEEDAPRLFELVDELRARVKGAVVHHVLITRDFNAAIMQCPRFGLFGGYRNYLILGLPLLYALTPDEAHAVIAHEYGHLAGGHGKLSRWIYRQRATFGALHEHARARREQNKVNRLLAWMLDVFAPYYHAYTFVLSRQNEYDADALARDVAGAEPAAAALIRTSLLATWLDGTFWPKIYEPVSRSATPPFMPFVSMRKLLPVTMDEWASKERLQAVWKEESGVLDTHPCLRERVTALAQRAKVPPLPQTCAADALLGPFAQALAREFDQEWWAAEKSKWASRHHRHTRSQARIAQLEARPVAELNAPDAQELALLLVEFRSLEAAKAVLHNLVHRSGERFPKPLYYYGRVLLAEKDERGLQYLEEAYRLSTALWNDCASAGYRWLTANRSPVTAKNWVARLAAIHAQHPG
jgi:Zn-dependent protease with chaperone function